jgi:hypothetical protein
VKNVLAAVLMTLSSSVLAFGTFSGSHFDSSGVVGIEANGGSYAGSGASLYSGGYYYGGVASSAGGAFSANETMAWGSADAHDIAVGGASASVADHWGTVSSGGYYYGGAYVDAFNLGEAGGSFSGFGVMVFDADEFDVCHFFC